MWRPGRWSPHTIDMEILSQNPYFSVVKKELKCYDGSSNQYYIVEFPRPAVGVLRHARNRGAVDPAVPANCE